MSDPRLSRMLRRAGSEPSEEFVSKLRRDLMADLQEGTGASARSAKPADDAHVDLTISEVPFETGGRARRQRRPAAPRRRWPLLVAAAVVIIVAGVVVLTRRHTPATITPATTVPHSFSQQISVDVQTPGGANVHVEGTMALPQAVESNESSIQPMHDVLLLPTLAATLTNNGQAPVTVAQAFVEIFLRGDRSGCIINVTGCDGGVITGQRVAVTPPTVLGGQESVPLAESGNSSRISVPAGEVPFAIDQVHDGSMVVGYAVVVRAGAGGDDVGSVVFDRSGHVVLTCASKPEDCLGLARAALGEDAAPVSPAGAAGTGLPSGALAPGVHDGGAFRIPLTFATTRVWDFVGGSSNSLTFRRSTADPTVLDEVVALVVLPSTAERHSANDVVNQTCADSQDRTPPSQTTLYGKPAIAVTVVLSADCVVVPDLSREVAPRGYTMRITATDIGNGQFLVALAISKNELWAKFSGEVDALIASITPS